MAMRLTEEASQALSDSSLMENMGGPTGALLCWRGGETAIWPGFT